MGDRANIFFRTATGGIGIYTHESGLEVAATAATAVASKAQKKEKVAKPTAAAIRKRMNADADE
jgi:hypothetical protein